MSYMSVQGKVYHCKNCNFTFTVEYQGGLLHTHIGEVNIIKQKRLSKLYGSNPGYLHEEIICSDCIKNKDALIVDDTNNPFNELYYLNDSYSETLSKVANQKLIQLLTALSSEQCKMINPVSYDESLGSKAFKLNGLRPKLINKFVSDSNDLINNFYMDLVCNDNEIQFIYKEYENKYTTIMDCINILNIKEVTDLYYRYEISNCENLHDTLLTQDTVRVVEEPYRKSIFYKGPFSIPDTTKLYIRSMIVWNKSEVIANFTKKLQESC